MDAARAVAITAFPSPPSANEFEKMYPNFRDELDVLPNTATATAAVEQLVQGKCFTKIGNPSQEGALFIEGIKNELGFFIKTILRVLSRFVYNSRNIQSTFSFLIVKNLLQKRLMCTRD